MKLSSLHLAIAAALLAPSGAAMAAPHSRPVPNVSEPDTLAMSCDQARALVTRSSSAVLRSGPQDYDRYHVDDASCLRREMQGEAAFVPTRDNRQCFIGYTCEGATQD